MIAHVAWWEPIICVIQNMSPALDTYCTDPAQHPTSHKGRIRFRRSSSCSVRGVQLSIRYLSNTNAGKHYRYVVAVGGVTCAVGPGWLASDLNRKSHGTRWRLDVIREAGQWGVYDSPDSVGLEAKRILQSSRRTLRPKKNQAKNGIWATFSHSKHFFVGWDWFYIGNRLQ